MKNISLAQQSIDASSTKEYSNNIKNTILTQITPSSFMPIHLSRIKNENLNNNFINLAQEQINQNKKAYNSVSASAKTPQNIINFNSIKLYSPRSTKNFTNGQNMTKMKLIELNSNSNNRNKEKNLYKSLNPSFNEARMTSRTFNSQKSNTSRNKKNKKKIILYL